MKRIVRFCFLLCLSGANGMAQHTEEVPLVKKEDPRGEVVDYLNIRSSGIIESVEVFSESGILLKELRLKDNEVVIPFLDLAPGIYYVKINRSRMVKVIKE